MGWKQSRKGRVQQNAVDMLASIPDELIGSCIYNALKMGGGILIGQTRNRQAVSVKLYEGGESSPPQYANNSDELLELFMDLIDYQRKQIGPENTQNGSGATK